MLCFRRAWCARLPPVGDDGEPPVVDLNKHKIVRHTELTGHLKSCRAAALSTDAESEASVSVRCCTNFQSEVCFSLVCNTPFQGLAADRAKLALWVYRVGFRTVALVHDEALIELPVEAEHTEEAKRIDSILCESMAQLTGTIPIVTEFALSDR